MLKHCFRTLFIASLLTVRLAASAQQVMMQGWYWDYPKTATGQSWADTLRLKAASLQQAGITHVWFPPHTVASFGNNSNGYDPKDLFIGNQTTGLGTRASLNAMLSELTVRSITPVADMVYNHRDGGRLEANQPVKDYITTYYNAAKNPYPSDRFRCALPLGGTSGNGAGTYYIRISSKSGDGRFNGKAYQLQLWTNKTGKAGSPQAVNESEPNGGTDCRQVSQTVSLNKLIRAKVETGGSCNTDEFKITLKTTDFKATDSLFISLTNPNNDYSDHRIYALINNTRKVDVAPQVVYQTYTDFAGLPSGRGAMNYDYFKPNISNASTTYLNGDWDSMLFFYDYDQFQNKTRDTLIAWTKWNWDALGVRALRMDAVKHFTPAFVSQMLNEMTASGRTPNLVVGEWYSSNTDDLSGWITNVTNGLSPAAKAAVQPKVFDFALREQLRLSCDDANTDVRNVFAESLHDKKGTSGYNIVTFLNNHDFRDQSGFSSLVRNTPMLGYAYLLTNNQLGVPTIFYPDYYGYPAPSGGKYSYHPTNLTPMKPEIDKLIRVLQQYIVNAPGVDYLNRFGTPYTSNYSSGTASKALIYQLQGSATNGNRDVLVAINFGTTPLKVDHQINQRGGTIGTGTRFTDVLARSAFPYAQVNGSGQVYMELPARSYSVWVQGDAPVVTGQTGQPASLRVNAAPDERPFLRVMPNPVQQVAHLQLNSPVDQTVSITLIGPAGRPLQQQRNPLTEGINSISVDVSRHEPGLYQIVVSDGVSRWTEKVLIE